MARPASSPAFGGSRCGGLGGRPARPTLRRVDASHGLRWISLLFPLTVLADATNRFIWRLVAPAPHRHLTLSSLPLSFDLSPRPGLGTLERTTSVPGEGDLIFPLVWRTRSVKNVNNRLTFRTGQRGRRRLLTRNASRVFACCICNPLVVVVVLFFLFFVLNRNSCRGRGRSGERDPRVEEGRCSWYPD